MIESYYETHYIIKECATPCEERNINAPFLLRYY